MAEKVKIFLFENNPDTIMIIENGLTDYQHIVETSIDADSGMNAIQENPPDIVIANFDYPDLSGIELIKKINESGKNIPVILFGPRSEKNASEATRHGAVEYWAKPLFAKEMKKRIDSIRNTISAPKAPAEKPEVKAGKEKVAKEEVPTEKAVAEKAAAEKKAPAEKELKDKDFTGISANIGLYAREKKELEGLLKITSALNVSGDTKISLNHLTDLAAEIMNCEAASIMLINEREKALEFVVATGEKKHRLDTIKVPMGEGIAGWVAINGKPQIVNDTKSDKRFTGKVDQESGFVSKNILAVPMFLDSEIIGVLEVINTKDGRDFNEKDLQGIMAMAERIAVVITATKKIQNQQNFYIQTTNIIVKAIEKKDMYAGGHAWKVAEYCHKVSTVMNFSKNNKDDLHFGALMHDIGKLVLPSYIFNKREISERDKDLIMQHPVQGAKLLEPITLWKSIVPYVLYHHEAWDGSGYPLGKSGNSIPLGARIICLAEAFSIMRASSSYKKQMTLKDTILEIMRASGKQFDPDIVEVFIGVLEKENRPA